jgi:hypothetical protein
MASLSLVQHYHWHHCHRYSVVIDTAVQPIVEYLHEFAAIFEKARERLFDEKSLWSKISCHDPFIAGCYLITCCHFYFFHGNFRNSKVEYFHWNAPVRLHRRCFTLWFMSCSCWSTRSIKDHAKVNILVKGQFHEFLTCCVFFSKLSLLGPWFTRAKAVSNRVSIYRI